MAMFDEFEIVGHRGAMAYAPENTITSFEKALSLGATSVELDLRFTADHQIVVIHDEDITRTTNGQGRVIDLTYDEIRRMDAGSWFSPEYTGLSIPLFKDVLKVLRGKAGVMVEIKDEPSWEDDENIMLVIRQLKELEMLEQAEIISFNHSIVKRFKEKEPAVMTGILYRTSAEPWVDAAAVSAEVIHPCPPAGQQITETDVADAHRHGLKVLATTNCRDEMENLIACSVDGICSNHPDWIRDAFNK